VDSDTIRVLLIDDDQGDFEMTRVMLSEGGGVRFSVEWVSSFQEALDAFRRPTHDVYLVDYFLEDRTGLDLLREAKEEGVTAPLIMLTGRGDAQVNRAAISAGAADYLVKGETSPEALVHAIRRAVEHAQAFSKSSNAQDEFQAVFRLAATGIAVIGLDGTILDANPAFRRFFAIPDEETEGGNYLDILDGDERPAVARELNALSKGNQDGLPTERRFLKGSGEIVWARVSLSLIRNSEAGADHILVLLDTGPGSARLK